MQKKALLDKTFLNMKASEKKKQTSEDFNATYKEYKQPGYEVSIQ